MPWDISSKDSKSGRKLIKLHTVDSTHLFALRLLESRAIDCDVTISAQAQTAGIGRCGRTWSSHADNLFMSAIKKIGAGNELSLVVACALREVMLPLIGFEKSENLTLHWPNDIYYNGKKLSGILIASVDGWFVISVGVNIHSVPDVETATSLREIRYDLDVHPMKLLHQIEDSIDKWLQLDFSEVRDYWMAHTRSVGEVITIKNGRDSLLGIYQGIDSAGKLILAVDGKDVLVSSGDMFENMDRIILNGVV